jgi:AcrR family transcriptional regulator
MAKTARNRLRDARQNMYQGLVLDAAETVFADHGYENAKVQSIAAAAGVSLATLYAAFATKWDIYRAVHIRRLAQLQEAVSARGDAGGPLATMLSGIDAYVDFHMRHPDYLRMHLREGHAWATASALRSPEQTSAWKEGLALMVKAFEGGIRAGVFIEDEEPLLLARTLIAMHQVRLADWVAEGMKESIEDVTQKIHRQFIRAFCKAEVAAEQLGIKRAGRAARSA